MEPPARAQLLDGVSPRPRLGAAEVVGDEVVFVGDDAQRVVWNVGQVLADHGVAGERRIEIAAGHDEPSVTLIVDVAFAQRLEDARSRYGSAGVGEHPSLITAETNKIRDEIDKFDTQLTNMRAASQADARDVNGQICQLPVG